MKILQNTSLVDYTSLHAGGVTKRLIIVETGDDLAAVLAAEKDFVVLGYGTNCLVSENGLPDTVILNQSGQIEEVAPGRLRAGSGCDWDDLVQATLERNLWGMEFTSGIPGGVGAAVRGNIAAYGQSVANTFVEARILNPVDGSVTTWGKEQLGFDYRTSALSKDKNLVVLDATFELSTSPTGELKYDSALKTAKELGIEPDSLANRRKIILATREKAGALLTDVKAGPWTAGSFFKNPLVTSEQVDAIVAHEEFGMTRDQLLRQNQIHGASQVRVSAAHVLLAAGFKRGQTWGAVRLHPDHILKIENTGQATGQEIYDVVQEIIKTVKEKLNITLEPEVQFLGEFNRR